MGRTSDVGRLTPRCKDSRLEPALFLRQTSSVPTTLPMVAGQALRRQTCPDKPEVTMPAQYPMSPTTRQYLLITANYWAFTLTARSYLSLPATYSSFSLSDGALRLLVVLHFHCLGYSPLEIALLFLFYEIFGVITNLVGGWLGAHLGLNRTMNIGLGLQVVALGMLLVPAAVLTVPWVMAAQALSGVAKDLNKMSAKSTIKLLVPEAAQGTLYKWVALLTGSKNALKGAGFFL